MQLRITAFRARYCRPTRVSLRGRQAENQSLCLPKRGVGCSGVSFFLATLMSLTSSPCSRESVPSERERVSVDRSECFLESVLRCSRFLYFWLRRARRRTAENQSRESKDQSSLERVTMLLPCDAMRCSRNAAKPATNISLTITFPGEFTFPSILVAPISRKDRLARTWSAADRRADRHRRNTKHRLAVSSETAVYANYRRFVLTVFLHPF